VGGDIELEGDPVRDDRQGFGGGGALGASVIAITVGRGGAVLAVMA